MTPIVYHTPLWDRSKEVWIVVGGGPSKDDWLQLAYKHNASIVAVNEACTLISNPDVFIASDNDAIQKCKHTFSTLFNNGCDVRIGDDVYLSHPKLFHRNTFRARTVSLHGILHAIQNGAKKIILCGLDGWPDNEQKYRRSCGGIATRQGSNENTVLCIQLLKKVYSDVTIEFSRESIITKLLKGIPNQYENVDTQHSHVPADGECNIIDGSCVRNIERIKRYEYDQPILVLGQGQSAEAEHREGYKIMRINPRESQDNYDFGVVADFFWWVSLPERVKKAINSAERIIIPKYYGSYKIVDHPKVYKASMFLSNVPRVGIVSRVMVPNSNHRPVSAHCGSIMAVMCALYLTRGKVVVSGCDLSGANETGSRGYEAQQLSKWKLSSPLWDRVYASKNMSGPLVTQKILPVENDER